MLRSSGKDLIVYLVFMMLLAACAGQASPTPASPSESTTQPPAEDLSDAIVGKWRPSDMPDDVDDHYEFTQDGQFTLFGLITKSVDYRWVDDDTIAIGSGLGGPFRSDPGEEVEFDVAISVYVLTLTRADGLELEFERRAE